MKEENTLEIDERTAVVSLSALQPAKFVRCQNFEIKTRQ